jgi:hypothetical protein
MHAMFAKAAPPALSVFVLLGFGALAGLLILLVKVMSLKMSGWKSVVESFPMRTVDLTGEVFRKQDGVIGNIGSGPRGFFDTHIAQEGLCVYPAFARKSPCFIPWSAIRRVSVSDTSLLVTVSYERAFEFFLPIKVLPMLQTKLSADSFHKAVSPIEAARKTIQDGSQPRWMSAIVGLAVRQVEKEREKRRHDDAP